jgi:hypothetical protein
MRQSLGEMQILEEMEFGMLRCCGRVAEGEEETVK